MRQSSIVAGCVEMWEPVYAAYGRLLGVGGKALTVFNEMRKHEASFALDEFKTAIWCMICAAANTFGAIQTLVLNGYGRDAFKLSRGVYEIELNVVWLKQHPEDVEDFLGFGAIRRKKLLDEMDEEQRKQLPEELHDEILREYAAALPRFATKKGTPRREWCRVRTHERAKDAGLLGLHQLYYPYVSSMLHCDADGLTAQTDSAGMMDMAPSWNDLANALVAGTCSFIRCLSYFDEIAALGFKSRLEELFGDYAAAVKTIPPVPAS
jgi:hypothetical protein